jgi:hypothetical protein
MAPRQGFDTIKEKTPLPRRRRDPHRAGGCPPVKTAWAIVFVCACASGGGQEAPSANSASHHAYDVLVTRESDTYRPRTYRASLATDGHCWRIAFYWLDPAEETEPTDALAFSDFLFDPNRVWYWHHKQKQTHTSSLEAHSLDPTTLLTTGKDLESILGSILSVVVHNRTPADRRKETMEAAQFFQWIRAHGRLKHTAGSPPADAPVGALVVAWAKGDCTVLDRLPFGRRFSKETNEGGDLVWRMSKASVAMDKVRVTIRPMSSDKMSGWAEISDPNTLGRWSAVPEAYHRYWSLRERTVSLRRQPDVHEAQRLHTDICSAMHGPLPDDVNAPLRELLFRTSLYTESNEAIRSSAWQYFNAYVRLAQEPVERIIIELGRIAQELRARWTPDQTRDFIRPLLSGIVDPKVFSDPEFVKEDVLKWIHSHGPTWSWYEQLVRETVREVTDVHLDSAASVPRVPGRQNRAATITDSEPNDCPVSADGQEHE